jgi:hypothetical protein
MGNVAQGTRKAWTLGKRSRAKPECNIGIRNQDWTGWLRVGRERTSDRIWGKTIGLEIVKRTAGSSVSIQKTCHDIMDGSAPSETKDTAQSRSHKYRWIGHYWNVCPHRSENKDDYDTPGPTTGTLCGNHSGQAALGREPRGGRWDKAQPTEKKKLRYACTPYETNSLMEGAM